MGGSVSSGKSNDELVDNLVESGLIKSNMIERVFRTVDRGTFYLPKYRVYAYRDLAWREGNLHISAPCIYTRVMEALELRAGLAFLNVGSGTGYFSSMVGLVLGENGVNHNIEIHVDLIDYARQKMVDFVKSSVCFDDFDFCMPKFVHGNFLNLHVDQESFRYDRIYVGAGVTDEHEDFLKNLLNVDGILVMPLNDCLVKIKRLDETNWDKTSLMNVSFASIITTDNAVDSTQSNKKNFSMPKLKPLKLQEICRFKIRQTIRRAIEQEDPEYYKIKRDLSTYNKDRLLSCDTAAASAAANGEDARGNQRGNDVDDDDDDEDGETSKQYVRGLETDQSDNDYEDDEDEDDDDEDEDGLRNTHRSSIAQFERIFRPRRGQTILQSPFDTQLKLMFYDRVLGYSSRLSSSSSANTANNQKTKTPEDHPQQNEANEDDDEDSHTTTQTDNIDSANVFSITINQRERVDSSSDSNVEPQTTTFDVNKYTQSMSASSSSSMDEQKSTQSGNSGAHFDFDNQPCTSTNRSREIEIPAVADNNNLLQTTAVSITIDKQESTSESAFSEESNSQHNYLRDSPTTSGVEQDLQSKRKRDQSEGYSSENEHSTANRPVNEQPENHLIRSNSSQIQILAACVLSNLDLNNNNNNNNESESEQQKTGSDSTSSSQMSPPTRPEKQPKETPAKQTNRENRLKSRINQLPISNQLKNFLLYFRDI